MIRVAIVEDESGAQEALCGLCERYSKESGESLNVRTFDNAVTFLTDYKSDFDLVFLDIEMPDLDGMTAAGKLRELDPYVPIVFVTNMQQYAIKGYSVSALDFLVKPVNYVGFSTLMTRVKRVLSAKEGKEIVISANGSIRRIPVTRISYIEVARHRLTYHTEEGTLETWGNLNDVESELTGELFSRCNACYLVNLRYVTGIKGDDVILSDGENLRISHLKRKAFVADVAAYLGRRR